MEFGTFVKVNTEAEKRIWGTKSPRDGKLETHIFLGLGAKIPRCLWARGTFSVALMFGRVVR